MYVYQQWNLYPLAKCLLHTQNEYPPYVYVVEQTEGYTKFFIVS